MKSLVFRAALVVVQPVQLKLKVLTKCSNIFQDNLDDNVYVQVHSQKCFHKVVLKQIHQKLWKLSSNTYVVEISFNKIVQLQFIACSQTKYTTTDTFLKSSEIQASTKTGFKKSISFDYSKMLGNLHLIKQIS